MEKYKNKIFNFFIMLFVILIGLVAFLLDYNLIENYISSIRNSDEKGGLLLMIFVVSLLGTSIVSLFFYLLRDLIIRPYYKKCGNTTIVVLKNEILGIFLDILAWPATVIMIGLEQLIKKINIKKNSKLN